MKHTMLAAMMLVLASSVSAQTQTNWMDLLTMSGTKVSAVEGATEIDIETAKAMYDRGDLFVDVQGYLEWKMNRVPGALLGSSITQAELELVADKDKAIVFYCDCDIGGRSCNKSPTASAKAAAWGYKDIYYFTNYGAWRKAGYKTEMEY